MITFKNRDFSITLAELFPMTGSHNHPKSVHIFTFPFKWDIKPGGKSLAETDFSKRTSLNDFHKILSTSHPPWRETFFKIAGPLILMNTFTFMILRGRRYSRTGKIPGPSNNMNTLLKTVHARSIRSTPSIPPGNRLLMNWISRKSF